MSSWARDAVWISSTAAAARTTAGEAAGPALPHGARGEQDQERPQKLSPREEKVPHRGIDVAGVQVGQGAVPRDRGQELLQPLPCLLELRPDGRREPFQLRHMRFGTPGTHCASAAQAQRKRRVPGPWTAYFGGAGGIVGGSPLAERVDVPPVRGEAHEDPDDGAADRAQGREPADPLHLGKSEPGQREHGRCAGDDETQPGNERLTGHAGDPDPDAHEDGHGPAEQRVDADGEEVPPEVDGKTRHEEEGTKEHAELAVDDVVGPGKRPREGHAEAGDQGNGPDQQEARDDLLGILVDPEPHEQRVQDQGHHHVHKEQGQPVNKHATPPVPSRADFGAGASFTAGSPPAASERPVVDARHIV